MELSSGFLRLRTGFTVRVRASVAAVGTLWCALRGRTRHPLALSSAPSKAVMNAVQEGKRSSGFLAKPRRKTLSMPSFRAVFMFCTGTG